MDAGPLRLAAVVQVVKVILELREMALARQHLDRGATDGAVARGIGWVARRPGEAVGILLRHAVASASRQHRNCVKLGDRGVDLGGPGLFAGGHLDPLVVPGCQQRGVGSHVERRPNMRLPGG